MEHGSLAYVTRCKTALMPWLRKQLRTLWSEKYTVRYQGRLYTERFTESLTPTFVALVDWLEEERKAGRFRNDHQLIPRSMSVGAGGAPR
jgi:hypothetical protein